MNILPDTEFEYSYIIFVDLKSECTRLSYAAPLRCTGPLEQEEGPIPAMPCNSTGDLLARNKIPVSRKKLAVRGRAQCSLPLSAFLPLCLSNFVFTIFIGLKTVPIYPPSTFMCPYSCTSKPSRYLSTRIPSYVRICLQC